MSDLPKKFLVLVISGALSAILVVGAYEIVENIRYYRWRADFGGTAWLGAVTQPSDDPELMWEYAPHSTHKRISTNQWGFRGRDLPKRKVVGEQRVAFIGDSVTLGYGEEEEDIFLRVFEQLAWPIEDHDVTAMNFGIDGYATPQIRRLLETRVLAFEPNQVIYTMCLNDFDFTSSAGNKVLYFRKPGSFFLRKFEHLVRRIRGIEFHTFKFGKNRDEVYEHLIAMRDTTRQADADFHLVLLPIFPVDVNSFAYYPHQELHDDIRAFAHEQGIPFTDILDEFRRRGGPPRAYANDVWHPNPDGHRVIGESMLWVLGMTPPPE
ncbi:MAG: SGNH/GDSL hydrolase family protein [Acidobacteriota bacterium]